MEVGVSVRRVDASYLRVALVGKAAGIAYRNAPVVGVLVPVELTALARVRFYLTSNF